MRFVLAILSGVGAVAVCAALFVSVVLFLTRKGKLVKTYEIKQLGINLDEGDLVGRLPSDVEFLDVQANGDSAALITYRTAGAAEVHAEFKLCRMNDRVELAAGSQFVGTVDTALGRTYIFVGWC